MSIDAMKEEDIEKLLKENMLGGHDDCEIRLDDIKQTQYGEVLIYTILTKIKESPHLHVQQRVAFFDHKLRKTWDMIAS
jgi:hypothetical protein